ncbi:chaperone NapD [Avibacterium paragallinarum]|uniref:Chaperone NapD n=1 Tax=Avibacterium paragallinarum TaxID=728 RepID=A0A0F5EZ75_AVIPA|nr:chaperone NapD [Avibacterium paragallinarum]AZI14940.1 chaperone NapD [Avibacterium paragallinarum]KAA6208970.1 chaperone NapD [Avibacterium paragallinarum]KKB01826.1 nitrate reductase [Avibacterium paragallinarum]MEE3609600.1 chaperone NapD [Avibacterium paragallinarum]MEE3621550.1 chaperone NapD [Avibacterium paragallinarum]
MLKKYTVTPMEQAQEWHVCGLVVQCNPQKIAKIKTALLSVPHTEIPAEDVAMGKLVVVMQSHDQHILLEQMEQARDIDGVITVSLVYHQQDDGNN